MSSYDRIYYLNGMVVIFFHRNFRTKISAMKRLILATALACFSCIHVSAQKKLIFFPIPVLRLTGKLSFCFRRRSLEANINEGQASRLTAMQGYENFPKGFSRW
jgi:hypothetical protein